ncbi:MAG TPA: GxxExxY protein [Vicinamibacterales bacterium]|nr:GxxExxY protein [Vicinamibacterales bacterium]
MNIPGLHTDVTDSILKCAVAVHRELGPGLAEHSYQTSLALEFDAAGISYVDDRTITVRYRDVVVGWHRPDFVVADKVVVELKAVAHIDPVHSKQVLTYLRVTRLRVALLLNFNVATMSDGIKRYQL